MRSRLDISHARIHARLHDSHWIMQDWSTVEIGQASWRAGDGIAVGSSETDQRWIFGAPKVKR